ncbi:MAG: hypothetical protein LBH51_06710 [Treponema sp.]|jgi:hypothetical protein|nr:hypothetical protein [Treponema sp.]
MTGRLLFAWMIFGALAAPLAAQDFGFGFDGEDAAPDERGGSFSRALNAAAAVHGEVSASMTGYIDDFSEGLSRVKGGDVFSGTLNFSAAASIAEAAINLKIAPAPVYYDGTSPVYVDEAYIRLYFGALDIESGLRKITWGKADSFGPLDVVNPLDTSGIYQEMADKSDLMGIKIPRPLIRAAWRFGEFSKLEGLVVPHFEPHHIASSGRWAPAQAEMLSLVQRPNTSSLDYAQAGLRFTTTLGSSDIGAQYYYGRLRQPSVRIWTAPAIGAELLYNPYHQAGLDHARVVAGFNTRAEFAANITGDLKGDDGSVYNPSLAWSLGFDRDLFLGLNLNLQADETIRLMNDKVGSADIMGGALDSFDIEGGADMTATRVTAILSRKFLRDELEIRTAVVWGLEDGDFALMPALIRTKDALTIACSGGFFGGGKTGQLGQYHKNNFVKISAAYSF